MNFYLYNLTFSFYISIITTHNLLHTTYKKINQSDPEKSPKVHIPALNHIGLWVDNLDACVANLTTKGIKFAGGNCFYNYNNYYYYYNYNYIILIVITIYYLINTRFNFFKGIRKGAGNIYTV